MTVVVMMAIVDAVLHWLLVLFLRRRLDNGETLRQRRTGYRRRRRSRGRERQQQRVFEDRAQRAGSLHRLRWTAVVQSALIGHHRLRAEPVERRCCRRRVDRLHQADTCRRCRFKLIPGHGAVWAIIGRHLTGSIERE